MRTVAGGWQVDERVYVDTKPNPDRVPSPPDEVARFMASNSFQCEALSARITARQCEINRGKGLPLCGKCDQVLMAAEVRPKPRRRRKGGNPESPWRSQLYNRAALNEFEAGQAKP